ncbi:hypothetical protein G6F65_021571 [Rhizopus arrhizus]|nr:hypothetical protein G6F65_021571 [Rhizopus arrhizus]
MMAIQASMGLNASPRAKAGAPIASTAVTLTPRAAMATSIPAYSRKGLADRSARRPSTQLPAASPKKNAPTAAAIAWTSTPTISDSCLIHRIWKINDAPPDKANSAAAGHKVVRGSEAAPAAGIAVIGRADAFIVLSSSSCQSAKLRVAGPAAKPRPPLTAYLPCFFACCSKYSSIFLSTSFWT